MRIAVIAPPWLAVPPVGYGGTEHVLDDLCRSLAGLGHDVLLYATGDSTCPVERAWTYERGVGTADITPAAELRHALDAYAAVSAWGADVVHDHTLAGPLLTDRHGAAQVVTTNHGPFEGDLAAVYRRISERVPVIGISCHQVARTDVPVARVIHHGVDADRYRPGRGEGGYALFLGRMNPDKGVDAAVRVARAAGVPLRIAAKMREPAEREYFASRVEPLLNDEVEFLGEVGGEAKVALLGGATCLLNPIAWSEPFGMVMIEALACGTPVVATPLGAAPEIVDHGETGFLAGDEQRLAEAVRQAALLDRAACRRVAERRFSARRMAADHASLFAELLARKVPAG